MNQSQHDAQGKNRRNRIPLEQNRFVARVRRAIATRRRASADRVNTESPDLGDRLTEGVVFQQYIEELESMGASTAVIKAAREAAEQEGRLPNESAGVAAVSS